LFRCKVSNNFVCSKHICFIIFVLQLLDSYIVLLFKFNICIVVKFIFKFRSYFKLRKDRKSLPIFEQVLITDIANEGKAVARIGELVAFISHAVPGDIVDIQTTHKKKNFIEGHVIKIHHYSDKRIDPICSHFGLCGGCKWQNMNYAEQLNYKQKQVEESLKRIGKVENLPMNSILPSDKTTYYRNKLEYTFSNKRWLTRDEITEDDTPKELSALGFHIPGKFDKVLDVNTCYLQAEPSNFIRLAIKDYAISKNLTFFDLKKHEGFLRNLIIRTSTTGEVMIILAFHYEDKIERENLLNYLAKKFPEITSLMYVINPKHNDTISDLEIQCFKGNDHIFEKMEDLYFKIGPKSFYQTNSEQAYNLYKITREFANPQKDEVIYDLYTGTGTIANFIARYCSKVVGIEYVKEAIDDAKINSELNKIGNTSFYAGDIKDVLTNEFIKTNGMPDTIILDPPRAGVHNNVIESILFAMPTKIVYVSCNPATQARDIELLSSHYKVINTQPVDMFPHTHHVENVLLLTKKDIAL